MTHYLCLWFSFFSIKDNIQKQNACVKWNCFNSNGTLAVAYLHALFGASETTNVKSDWSQSIYICFCAYYLMLRIICWQYSSQNWDEPIKMSVFFEYVVHQKSNKVIHCVFTHMLKTHSIFFTWCNSSGLGPWMSKLSFRLRKDLKYGQFCSHCYFSYSTCLFQQNTKGKKHALSDYNEVKPTCINVLKSHRCGLSGKYVSVTFSVYVEVWAHSNSIRLDCCCIPTHGRVAHIQHMSCSSLGSGTSEPVGLTCHTQIWTWICAGTCREPAVCYSLLLTCLSDEV